METPVRVIGKKVFSLAMIFNALISLACIAGILFRFYEIYPLWQPYAPYFLNGSLFWLVLIGALINIFPSAAIGRALHTGRFLFHHYVYGFFVLLSTSAFIVVFTPVFLPELFFIDDSTVIVNAARVFVLAGVTLLLDDLPDVSERIESLLNRIKFKAYKLRKALHVLQLVTGLITVYSIVSIVLWTVENGERVAPNIILVGTLIATSLTSFALVKKKAWLKITITEPTIEPTIVI